MTPTVVDYPPEKQTNTIPHYKNDVSCCGGPGQEFTSTLGDRTDSMSIKENTGGDTYYGHKDPNDPRPCRPCSPSPVTGYEEPEKAPDEYMTPTMRNHVVSDILLEEKVKADPFGPTRVGHLLEGDEVNHMYMTPDKSVELPNGDIQMMNPAATPIGAYDPKVYEGMHEKIELIDDLDTLKHPCDHEGCEPPVVPEWAGCKSCVKKIGGFYTPEYSPRSPAHNDIEVVALEEQVVLLDKNLCSCECVSEKEFATANPAVAGACPVCPVCTPLGPKLVTSVSCAKAHEGLKRPECAPEPTATMAIHKYRKMQKTYTVIPEIAKGALN